jgi:hypothetical protein
MNTQPPEGTACASPGDRGVGEKGEGGGGSGEGGIHSTLDTSHAEFGDLDIRSLKRAVRTRLYFTSESHCISLLNVLRNSSLADTAAVDAERTALSEPVSDEDGKGGKEGKEDKEGKEAKEAKEGKEGKRSPVVTMSTKMKKPTLRTQSSLPDEDPHDASSLSPSHGRASSLETSVDKATADCLTAGNIGGGPNVAAEHEAHAKIKPADIINSAEARKHLASAAELNYLGHLVFRVFERFGEEAKEKGRFRVELAVSHGGSTPKGCGLLDCDEEEEGDSEGDSEDEESKEDAHEPETDSREQQMQHAKSNSRSVSATDATQMLKELQKQLRRDEREKELQGKLQEEQKQKKAAALKEKQAKRSGETKKVSKEKAGHMKQFVLEKAVVLEDSLTPEELVAHLTSCLDKCG